MCIIIAKKGGIAPPSIDTLKTCWKHNPDGCGITFDYKGKVYVYKGFMKWNDFEKFYSKLNKKIDIKKINMIYHFRISTSKNVNKELTHPFVVDKHKLAFAHNGIIRDLSYSNDEKSDTYNFNELILKDLYSIDKHFYNDKAIQKLLKNYIGYSKLAFLGDKGIFLLGDFISDNGLYYSNNSYKEYTYTNSTWNYSKNENSIYSSLYDYEDFDYVDFVDSKKKNGKQITWNYNYNDKTVEIKE